MPTQTKRYLSAAETAALVRGAVKDAHPGVKFSVRCRPGGGTIDVGWTDGPTTRQVEATAKRYAGATFDGMTDMREHHDSILSTDEGAEVVSFGADFVHCHRTLSAEFRAELESEIAEFTGLPYHPGTAYHASALGDRFDGPRELCRNSHGTSWGSELLGRLAENRVRPLGGEGR